MVTVPVFVNCTVDKLRGLPLPRDCFPYTPPVIHSRTS